MERGLSGRGFCWHTWAQPRPLQAKTTHVYGVSGGFLKGIGFHRFKDRIWCWYPSSAIFRPFLMNSWTIVEETIQAPFPVTVPFGSYR